METRFIVYILSHTHFDYICAFSLTRGCGLSCCAEVYLLLARIPSFGSFHEYIDTAVWRQKCYRSGFFLRSGLCFTPSDALFNLSIVFQIVLRMIILFSNKTKNPTSLINLPLAALHHVRLMFVAN